MLRGTLRSDREGYASEVEDQYKRDMEVMKEQLTSAETLIASQQVSVEMFEHNSILSERNSD